MAQYKFNMPVPAQDLPPAESLHQMFDSLKYLDTLVDDIFGRVSSRISFEKTRIASITQRVSNCKVQVDKISANPSKATTVHSSAKYPAPSAWPNYPRLCDELEITVNTEAQRTPYTLTKEEKRARPERVDTSDLFAKLTDPARYESQSVVSSLVKEGLGRLPSNVPSVSSILLFNTGENPYKKYTSLDNLEGVAGKDREQKIREVGSAPQTLIDGDMLPVFAGIDFGFKPKMSDVPTFSLPSVLPDLPGVADIAWSMDAKVSIAPSQAPLLALPSPLDLKYTSSSSAKQPASASTVSVPALPAPAGYTPAPTPVATSSSTSSAPPPGPPAGPPAGPPVGPPVAGPPVGPPGPPPPSGPPVGPPGPPPAASAPPPNIVAAPPNAAPEVMDTRSALLDSIRNPGLRLRKVAKAMEEDSNAPAAKSAPAGGDAGGEDGGKKKSSAPPPMDMMSALQAKLKARAKIMSGKTSEEDDKKPAALPPPSHTRQASVLPKPPTKEDSMSNSSMANVSAYLAHKESKSSAKDDDDDWE